MILTDEQIEERIAKINELKDVMRGLENEVKQHHIERQIQELLGENVELMQDVIEFPSGIRMVLVDMNTQLGYNHSYAYPDVYGLKVKKDLTLGCRCQCIYNLRYGKVIGKLEDLRNG